METVKWMSEQGLAKLRAAQVNVTDSVDSDINDFDVRPVEESSIVPAYRYFVNRKTLPAVFTPKTREVFEEVALELDRREVPYSGDCEIKFSAHRWTSHADMLAPRVGRSWQVVVSNGENSTRIDKYDLVGNKPRWKDRFLE